MKLLKSAIAILLTLPILSQAGEVKVSWGDFDDFIDVRPVSETKSSFYERIKRSFDKSFNDLSSSLPEDFVFEIKITDLDLAGDIRYGGVKEFREIDRIFYPKMKFDYQLINASGEILSEGSESIKDMDFLDQITPAQFRSDAFYYEKHMFVEWFEENIEVQFK